MKRIFEYFIYLLLKITDKITAWLVAIPLVLVAVIVILALYPSILEGWGQPWLEQLILYLFRTVLDPYYLIVGLVYLFLVSLLPLKHFKESSEPLHDTTLIEALQDMPPALAYAITQWALDEIKDEKEAFAFLEAAAGQENADAQYKLGVMYANGRGVKKNQKEAVKWYQRAAKQGNANAQTNLGAMYAKGRGVIRDDGQAVKWYKEAEKQGNADAQFNLGWMHDKGRGVTKDYKEAVQLYQKAAEQGFAQAQTNLGLMYAYGKGVTQDYRKAIDWFQKAAEQENIKAQINLVAVYSMSDSAIKNPLQAVYWFNRAARQVARKALKKLGIAN